MQFLEFKTTDKVLTLIEVAGLLLKPRLRQEALSGEHYFYVNEKRQRSLEFKVKPKSQVFFCFKLRDSHIKSHPMDSTWIEYEDNSLVVLNKPAGLSTQSTLKSFETHLYGEARLYYLKSQKWPVKLPYLGLHHRLDRDTSGLVLMTKKRSMNREVSQLFQNRKIKKSYLALVEAGGSKPPLKWKDAGRIKRGFSRKHPFIFKVVKEGGDEALSEFKYIKTTKDGYHLLEALPKTGRTHQLRVHLSNRGWPIVGDRVYGKISKMGLGLHAYKLEFYLKDKLVTVQTSSHWLSTI